MRVEANVSLRPRGTEPFGTRVEVKNMNSFRAVERAIAYEIERQAAALDAGETLTQDTRGWDDGRQATYVMRSKEDSHDYRYFPEPDLPPLRVDAAWLETLRARLPELPAARRGPLPGRPRPVGLRRRASSSPTRPWPPPSRRSGSPGRTCPTKEVANLVTGDYGRAAKLEATRTPDGLVGRADGGRAGRPPAPGGRRRAVAGERQGGPGRASRAGHAGRRPSSRRAGLRQISDAGALGSIIDDGAGGQSRPPSPTIGPASRRRSASSSARS